MLLLDFGRSRFLACGFEIDTVVDSMEYTNSKTGKSFTRLLLVSTAMLALVPSSQSNPAESKSAPAISAQFDSKYCTEPFHPHLMDGIIYYDMSRGLAA